VIAGTSTPLQAPLPENFHWGPRLWGHEGVGVLPPEDLIPTADPDTNADAAARFIIEKAPAHPGELSLITVGPLTTRREAMACLGATTKRYVSHSNGTGARGFLELLTGARFVCGHRPGTYMHDPLAIYASMASHFVNLRRMHVQLEVHDRVLRSVTYRERLPNTRACVDVDAPAFVRFWLKRVKQLATTTRKP
jgi:inosine-uridine nucleoside N-ribohydrolase